MTEIFVLTPLFHFPSTFNKSEIFSICRQNIEGVDLEFLPINNERIGIVLKDSKFTMESIEYIYRQNAYLMNQLKLVTDSLNVIQDNYINDQKLIKSLKNEVFILKKIESDLTNRLEDQVQVQRDSESKADKLIIQIQQQLTASINIIRAITHVHPHVLEDDEFLTNINCNTKTSSSSPSSPLITSVNHHNITHHHNSNSGLNSPVLSSASSTPTLINKHNLINHHSQHQNQNQNQNQNQPNLNNESLSSPSPPFSISSLDGGSSSSSSTTTPNTIVSTPVPITAQRRPSTFNLSISPTTAKEVDKIKHLISQYIKNCNTSNRPYSNRNHYNFKFDSTLISTINHFHYQSNSSNHQNNQNQHHNNSSNQNNNTNQNINNANKIKKLIRSNTLGDISSFLSHNNKKEKENEEETKCRKCPCSKFESGLVEWLCSCNHSNISHLNFNTKKQNNNINNNQNNNIIT